MAIKQVTVTVHGQTVTLTKNESTGKYEGQLTAPADSSFNESGGYFPASVKVTDTAGNSTEADSNDETFGEKLRLFVKEKNKPVVSIISPSGDAYITTDTPMIRFKATDNNAQQSGYSGIDKASCVITVGGETVRDGISWEETEGGFIGSFTPTAALSDGRQELRIDISDNDGNAAETAVCTFTVDTVAPSLTLSSPAEGLETNVSELEIIGVTNDETSKPVTVKITLNGSDCGDVTVSSDGSFSKTINLSKQGENIIVVSAADKAGKITSVQRTVVYNTTAPKILAVEFAPNPVAAGTLYTVTVSVQE